MVKYVYDAWGNHEVRNTDGNELVDHSHIGCLNPFRYRGYYYDTETKLYYLKLRYYDPEVGRFITIDDISCIDSEHINGLNLYAYCGNNPVMDVDPNGAFSLKKFIKKALATLAVVAVAAVAVAVTVVTLGTAAPVLAAGIIGGIAAGGINIITQGWDKGFGNINWGDVAIQSLSGLLYGVASVALPGVGGMFVKAGISGATSIASGIYHGDSVQSVIVDSLFSFATSFGIQSIMKTSLFSNEMDKLNFSHWFGKGRYVDFVSDKVFDKTLMALDFGNYFTRELTLGLSTAGKRLFSWIKKKIIG